MGQGGERLELSLEIAEGEVRFGHNRDFAKDFHFHGDDTGGSHIDFFGRGEAEVEDATFGVRAAVIDSDDDIFAVFQVSDSNHRVEREGFVSRCNIIYAVDFAICRFVTDPSAVVKRSFASLGEFGFVEAFFRGSTYGIDLLRDGRTSDEEQKHKSWGIAKNREHERHLGLRKAKRQAKERKMALPREVRFEKSEQRYESGDSR